MQDVSEYMSESHRLTRAESQARTREALFAAAARVFVERGLHGASVEAITAEAGFTRGAFYSNFATKEQLFAELLQDRIYSYYRGMAERQLAGEHRDTARETGEKLAAMQANPDGRWMFRLWLELLAHAGRSEPMRELAAEFWSGNRALVAELIARTYAARGVEPPADPAHLASATIAMDVGLALQHYVDPEGVPLTVYPEVFDALFGS